MLTGPSFSDDTSLAHTFGQQCLTQYVVDLVRTRVIQVFTLKQDPSTPGMLAEILRVCYGVGTPGICPLKIVVLGNETWVGNRHSVRGVEFL